MMKGPIFFNLRLDEERMVKVASCPICASLGSHKAVDFDADQHFPDAMLQLEMVQWFDDNHDLRRCPRCGTFYDCTFETDNDIFCPTHLGEYNQIPEDAALKMVQEEQTRLAKLKQRYRQQIRKLHGKAIKGLSEIEKTILAYFTDQMYQKISKGELEKELNIPPDALEPALQNLIQKEILRQWREDEKDGKYHIRTV